MLEVYWHYFIYIDISSLSSSLLKGPRSKFHPGPLKSLDRPWSCLHPPASVESDVYWLDYIGSGAMVGAAVVKEVLAPTFIVLACVFWRYTIFLFGWSISSVYFTVCGDLLVDCS